MSDVLTRPPGLPVPIDDGAADHLRGAVVLRLTRSRRPPTFGRIEHVSYPVFPPDQNAATVLAWLRATRPVGVA